MDQDYKRIFRPWASESWNEDVPLINETVLGVVEERQRVTPASEERLPFTKELRSDLPGGHRPNRLESSRAEKTQLSCEMTNLGRSGGQCQKIVMPTVKRPVVPTVVPISRNRYVDGFSNGYDSTGRLQNPSAMSERDKRVCPTSNNPDSQHISNNLYNRTYTQSLMSSGGANGCFAGGRQLIQANYTAYDVMLQQMIHDKLLRKAEQQKKQRPKKFQCPHCRVSFSNNGQLKGHIRIHTGK
ncbi:hkb (predicted) [Pycnogonum litorale]